MRAGRKHPLGQGLTLSETMARLAEQGAAPQVPTLPPPKGVQALTAGSTLPWKPASYITKEGHTLLVVPRELPKTAHAALRSLTGQRPEIVYDLYLIKEAKVKKAPAAPTHATAAPATTSAVGVAEPPTHAAQAPDSVTKPSTIEAAPAAAPAPAPAPAAVTPPKPVTKVKTPKLKAMA